MKKKSIALLLALVMLLSVLSEGASVTAFADDNSESVSCHISSASHGNVQGVFTNHNGILETTSKSGDFTSSAKPGTEFKVTAFPYDGYYFTGWWLHDDTRGLNYDLVSYSPTYSFTANERISLQATFADDAERCIVNGTAGGGVKMEFIQENGNSDSMSASNNANMSAVVKHNTEVTLTATPQDTYAFMGWYDYEGGNCLSTDAAYTFSFTAQTHIKAVFKAPSVVTYKVVNGTWSDGTTADKTETVQSGSKPANVPTGMKASEGYTGGAWDTNPAEATITGATTFTYTFTKKQPGNGNQTNPNNGNQNQESSKQTETEAKPVVPPNKKEAITISKTPASVKAKAKKNKVTVSWKKIKRNKAGKKLLKQINSIQIQYSTDKKFKNNVNTKTVGKKKTKVKLKLQKKTTYYVRVRYKGANGFSKWSKVKKVKTKK